MKSKFVKCKLEDATHVRFSAVAIDGVITFSALLIKYFKENRLDLMSSAINRLGEEVLYLDSSAQFGKDWKIKTEFVKFE
jgi:hypothetical protein